MIKIDFLANHDAVLPQLAAWFRAQWPNYYGARDVGQDLRGEANVDCLPCRMVAWVGGELAGTIVLRDYAVGEISAYTPGLGGLYVAEPYRRQGVGRALIVAGMEVAQGQGYQQVYAGTVAVGALFLRLGWELVGWVGTEHDAQPVGVYRYEVT